MALRGTITRITCPNRKSGQKNEPAPQTLQGGMMRHQQSQQILQDVRARNGQGQFCEQRFQVLFRALLAKKQP